MDAKIQNRIRGCAVGAVCGDALGMPLEFCPPSPRDELVRDMLPGGMPVGSLTDDTAAETAGQGSSAASPATGGTLAVIPALHDFLIHHRT